jgi:hypothetical protein
MRAKQIVINIGYQNRRAMAPLNRSTGRFFVGPVAQLVRAFDS